MPVDNNRYQIFEIGTDGTALRQVTPSEPIEPILPEPPQATETVVVKCPDWPFDEGDAGRRQGDDRERQMTLDIAGHRPLELTLSLRGGRRS
jgi:hypothetical protein